MTDWTIEQFENAVKEVIEEKLDKEKTARETLEKLKEDLFSACKKFVNDTEEYWNAYCELMTKKISYSCQPTSSERFDIKSIGALLISRRNGEVHFVVNQRIHDWNPVISLNVVIKGDEEWNSVTLLNVVIKGDEVASKFNDSLTDKDLETLCKVIGNLKNNYLDRLVNSLKED